ncbi:HEAT repeat domain-containing protein [Streptomyces chartreusis]
MGKRLTKSTLSRRARLGRTSVSRAFSVSAPAPSAQTVSSLAVALGLDPGPLLRLREVAASGTTRGNHAPERPPQRSTQRPQGEGDFTPGPHRVDRSPEKNPDRVSDEAARGALAAYALRIRQTYAHLELDVLTPLSDQSDHPPVPLREVFVVPGLRADPPPVELPRELIYRLMESGDLPQEPFGDTKSPAEELKPAEDMEAEETEFLAEVREAVERLKDSYRRKPVVDALSVLTSEEGHRTVLLGDPGAGKSTLARYLALTLTRTAALEGPLATLAGHVPLLVELREYAAGEWRQRTFEDFIAHLHGTRGMAPPPSLTQQLLLQGRALVVFDGLDELFDPRIRRDTQHRIAGFAARYPAARVIVTSRTIGYQRAVLDGADFSHHMLQDLDGARISAFAHRWYALSCGQDPDHANRLAGQLVAAVTDSRPVRELAGNPLLLTILAIIGRRKVLPRDRRGVYEHAVTVLVAHWDQQAKHLEAELPATVASTLDALGERERTRLLQLLARAMQEGTGGIAGNHIHGSDLERLIGDHLRARYEIPPPLAAICSRAMVAQLRERNFILSRYGGEVYGFVHRAFLEYLAATDIIQRIKDDWDRTPKQYVEEIVTEHAADPAWHEVLLLLIGELGERAAAAAVDRILLLHAAREDPEDPGHVVLALRALAEVGAVGGLAGQSIAVVDAITDLLDGSADSSRLRLPAAAAAFQTFGPYWIGRDRYLRWYHLRGQFAEQSTEPAELVVALRPDQEELRTLAARSFYGPDREIFLKALADRCISQRDTHEFIAGRLISDPNPKVRLMAVQLLKTWPGDHRQLLDLLSEESDERMRHGLVDLLIGQWPHSQDVRESLEHCATRDPDMKVRQHVIEGLLSHWPDRADVQNLLVAVATEATGVGPALAAVEVLVTRALHDETLGPVLAQLAQEHASHLIRETALPAVLDRQAEDEARQLLLARVVRDEHTPLRLAAVQTLERMWPQDDNVRMLLRTRATEDPAPQVRWAALTSWVARAEDREEVRTVLAARMVGDESPDLRWGVLTALVERQPDAAQACFLLAQRAVDDADPEVRVAALKQLLDHRPQGAEVWARWAEFMRREEDGAARRLAVSALGEADLRRADVRAVLAATAMGDAVSSVRWAAATALSQNGERPDVRQVLLELGRGDAEADVRLAAISRLFEGWTEDEDVVSFFAERVRQDPEPVLRHTILEAWRTGIALPPDPISAFLAITAEDTEPALRLTAMAHLADHHRNHQEVHSAFLAIAAEETEPSLRMAALTHLTDHHSHDQEVHSAFFAIAAEDTEPALRLTAMAHLADHHRNHQEVRSFLLSRIQEDPAFEVRWRTALRFWDGDGPIPDDEVAVLTGIAADAPTGSSRWAAVAALGRRCPDEERVRTLLVDRAAHDTSARVRWAATLALSQRLPAGQMGSVLAQRVAEDPDCDVRWAALGKLRREIPADAEWPKLLLRVAAEDEHPTMRWAAAALLTVSPLAGPRLRAALTERAEHDPDRDIRWAALKALAVLWNDDEVRSRFAVRAAEDSDADLRWAAAVVLANQWPDRSAAAVQRLHTQVCSASDAESRWLALAALVEMHGAVANEPLLAGRAESDPDLSIRKAAFDVSIGAVPPGSPITAFRRRRTERLLALQYRLLTAKDDGRLVAERSAVHDPDPAIRRRVLAMIALHWPDRRTTVLLAERGVGDADPKVRAYATRLLDTFRKR